MRSKPEDNRGWKDGGKDKGGGKEKAIKKKRKRKKTRRNLGIIRRLTFTSRRLCVAWRCPLIHDSLRDSEAQWPLPSAALELPMNDHIAELVDGPPIPLACSVLCGSRVEAEVAGWKNMRENSSTIRRWDDIISSNRSLPPLKEEEGHPKGPKGGDRPNGNGREKKSSLVKNG